MLLIALVFTCAVPVDAEPMCPVNENIAEDMRIPEVEFNKENAEAALARLAAVVRGERKPHDWTEVPNALKIIEGYILRKYALEEMSAAHEFHREQFCLFMRERAWWVD